MRFGLYVPAAITTIGSPEIARQIAESRKPLPPGRRDAQYEFCVEFLALCDRIGFHLGLFAERHLGSDLGAWMLAGAIATRFENMAPIVAVHPGLIDPALVAKFTATLDRMCKNRVAINIVNGWYEREFQMFGGKVLEGEARYRRAVEFIEIVRGLWREEKFSYHGSQYTLADGELMLKPATTQPPQIFSVSNTDLGRDYIAESCDWWFISLPKNPEATYDDALRTIETSIADMDKRAARFGRKVRYAVNPFVALGESAEAALRQAVEAIYAYEPDPENRGVERVRQIERRMLPATKAGFMGAPKDVRAQVRRFESMGIELMLLKFVPSMENTKRIGEEVLAYG